MAPDLLATGGAPVAGLDYDDDHVLHAPSLRFAVAADPFGHTGGGAADPKEDARRLIAAVDAALARRADADVEALEIDLVHSCCDKYVTLSPGGFHVLQHHHAADVTPARVAAWLGFAARRITGSLSLAVPTLPRTKASASPAAREEEEERLRRVELPAMARADSISLRLGDARLAVPSAAAGSFTALSELLLSQVRIEPGGADEFNLGRLLSAACCPRLRRLRLEHITGLAVLRVAAAATLEEVALDCLTDMTDDDGDAAAAEAGARVSAPVLETLACPYLCHPDRLQLDGAAESVRRLEDIAVFTHGYPGQNDAAVALLRRCAAAHSLQVKISPFDQAYGGKDPEEMMSVVSQLSNIISLNIDAERAPHIEASIAKFISRCSRVERISVDIGKMSHRCFSSGEGEWDDKISLEHLREANITGFRPSEQGARLVKLMIAGAPALQRMTVKYARKGLDDGNLPCDRGHWALCETSGSSKRRVYEWMPVKETGEECSHILSKF
ncbi:unnamed protein product [Urochloa decumbens]|uniref:Uncharacterized protein n=1 Tax=Urochloa decumbens TaxID=240449 RepID=A0ABC9GDI1_9POAL